MKAEMPPAAPALSLQGKLDHIAQERAVLRLMQELARLGLREGSRVQHRGDGRQGELRISRHEHPPRARVALVDGSQVDFEPDLWQRL